MLWSEIRSVSLNVVFLLLVFFLFIHKTWCDPSVSEFFSIPRQKQDWCCGIRCHGSNHLHLRLFLFNSLIS